MKLWFRSLLFFLFSLFISVFPLVSEGMNMHVETLKLKEIPISTAPLLEKLSPTLKVEVGLF